MTKAVCFKCGEIKYGAFVSCPYCNARPSEDEELILSLAMTDYYFDIVTMKQMGVAVKDGNPPNLNEKSRQDLMRQLAEFKKNPMSRLVTGNASITTKDPYLYLSKKELEQLEKEMLKVKQKPSLDALAKASLGEFLSQTDSMFADIAKEIELEKSRKKISFKIKRAIIRSLVIIGILKYN